MSKVSDARPGHFIVEDAVFSFDLTPFEGWVYMAILKHANRQTGVAFPGIATLAKLCRMSKRQVSRCIEVLEEKKIIKIDRDTRPLKGENRKRGVNHYTVLSLSNNDSQSSGVMTHSHHDNDSQSSGVMPKSPLNQSKETKVNESGRNAPLAILPEMVAANEGLRIVTPVKEKTATSPKAETPTPKVPPLPPPPKDTEPSLHSRPRDVMAENMRGWQIIETFIKAWPEDAQDRTVHHKVWFKKQAEEMAAVNPPFTDDEITQATKAGITAKGAKFTFDDLGQALKELRMNRKRSTPKLPELQPTKRRHTPEEFKAWQERQKQLEAANE